MSCVILGLDPSTVTGIALLSVNADSTTLLINRELRIKSGSTGLDRALEIKERVHSALDDAASDHPEHFNGFDRCIDLTVIEGYGYANKFTLVPMVEIGTILRVFMIDANIPYEEVAPASLKRFVTGNGRAKKDAVMRSVHDRWGHKCSNDNAADAVGLAYYGAWLLGKLEIEDKYVPKMGANKKAKYQCNQLQ